MIDEEKILNFWKHNRIFEKSLKNRAKNKKFIFYEGPPTANGLPHIGHALTRAFKDAILRYKTMRGFYVPRRAGWDTHGLPVEIEVEKKLGLKNKNDIEKYGIAKFNRLAKESVWQYKTEWEKSTEQLGFWLEMKNPYVTYENSYIETLWRIIKEFWKKKLLYQDFKVIPWCPRCQTGLSSHEVGLGGYKKIIEDSIYVKLKIKNRKNEYLLIWTTTPWTLPANVAVAVNSEIEYVKYKVHNQYIWSANKISGSIIEQSFGKKLVDLSYEPLYLIPDKYSLGAPLNFKVLSADFVSNKEGTGMVHIAPAFGEEDMNLMKTQSSKSKIQNYPILHTVNLNGTMKSEIIGEGKLVKEANKIIIEDLKKRKLLYKVESYEHDYPHCWRCDTPLLYFAKTSWWVKVTAVKQKLSFNNETINWVPSYLKNGRFGEFLQEARDWAFSRERFWGTPLPVWMCIKCGDTEVIGSFQELEKKIVGSKNQYFILRHGQAFSNLQNIISSEQTDASINRLTENGEKQIEKLIPKIKKLKIDVIYSSDLTRTKETAEIINQKLNIPIHYDPRLRELNCGVFHNYGVDDYWRFFNNPMERFTRAPANAETLRDLKKRVFNFLQEINNQYKKKNILIVSHGDPLWVMEGMVKNFSEKEIVESRKKYIKNGELRELKFLHLPYNEEGDLDAHRPYVDDLKIKCKKCKSEMRRIPEVADVWFDSGSMPFTQNYFPADFICEAVDQTRGWFYTLLAVSTLLGKGAPYKNVISLGHVLDKNGQKMSKSKGNVIDPREIIKKHGADALRWYFYTVNAAGEQKKFNENDLIIKSRAFLGTFWNSFILFNTYIEKIPNFKIKIPKNILDKWIIIKLQNLIQEVTNKLDNYDVIGAARAIEEFTINDFSQWYLRRSRRKFQQPKSLNELENTGRVTAEVLLILGKISAPFAPFLTEEIYQKLKNKLNLKQESVHLTNWPNINKKIKKEILENMEIVRNIVAQALKLRAEAGIKIRQPLAKIQIPRLRQGFGGQAKSQLLDLIKEELNVKNIIFGNELKLDTNITTELQQKGNLRELIRSIQNLRKEANLKPQQNIFLSYSFGSLTLPSHFEKIIQKEVNAKEIHQGKKEKEVFLIEREFNIESEKIWIGLKEL